MAAHIFQALRPYRPVIIGVLVLLVVLAGITAALRINLATQQPSDGHDLVVHEMVIGVLANPTDTAKVNPPLRNKSTYSTVDQLALRVQASSPTKQSFAMRARLIDVLNPQGNIIELDPPAITIQSGTSTFCCWTIARAGNYNLQLFRPEGNVTSISLVVHQDSVVPTPLVK